MSQRDKPILMILVKRTSIFALAICLTSLFYWAVGSRSSFLDATESMLIEIVRVSSLALVSASGLGLLLALAFALARAYRPRLAGLLGYALAAALGAAALVLSQGVEILSRGLP